MRVLHVIPATAARYGGPSRAVVGMCQALQRMGAAPLIASTDADGPSRLPVELGKETVYEGVRAVFFPRQFGESLKFSWPLARWLHRRIGGFEIVHIHAVFSHACLSAARACRLAGVPYVVRPLGTLAPWSLAQKRWRKRLLWQLAGRRMVGGAAAIHYTSVGERRQVERTLGVVGGWVIPLGIDERRPDTGSGDGLFRSSYSALGKSPYVLFLSRIDPKKRLESLIDAFARVTSQPSLRDWRLAVVGDGDTAYVERIRRRAVSTSAGDRIVFAGWLDGARKASALCGAELLVLPSHQENFGLSALEALASGVPVLLSDGVDIGEEVRMAGAGWIAPLGQDALRTTLEEVLTNDAERRRRGLAGRNFVRSGYTWSAVAKRLIDLYRGVTAGKVGNGA